MALDLTRLWAAADQLWANTGLRPADFSEPVLGLIFLRYADKRFAEIHKKLLKKGFEEAELDTTDYQAEGVVYLPEAARFSSLLKLTEGDNIGKKLNEAMLAVEGGNGDLKAVLPRSYNRLPNATLVELLRLLSPLDLEGDAFGKVYEYFLGAFARAEGSKGGVTKPEPTLTKTEEADVKKVCRELVEKQKREKLILDWREKQQARAGVMQALKIEMRRLPPPFTKEVRAEELARAYVHVYDHYFGSGQSAFSDVQAPTTS